MCLSNEVFINPFTDFGFKRIFGEEESKPFLISFLNDLLPIDDKIEKLEFKNIEKLGASIEDRKAVYDLFCTDAKGNTFIVELQRAHQQHFIDRANYYMTFPIQEQATRGSWTFELTPIYFIGILNFEVEIFKDDVNYVHYCQLTDNDTKKVIDKKINHIYIEIPKFKKTEEELSKHLDYWLYFFKELNTLKEIPKKLKNDIVAKAFDKAKFINLSTEEQTKYHINLKYYRDYINTLDTALEQGYERGMRKGIKEGFEKGIQNGMQKGLEKGLEQGIEQGRKQRDIEMAKNLLLANVDILVISQTTGLSVDNIKKISKEQR
jgi:predicted transposase/invertase (TIGR01784 family)